MKIFRSILVFGFIFTASMPVAAQNCVHSVNESQIQKIDADILENGPVVNSDEADNDLASFFEIVSGNVTTEEYEIFTMLHTADAIVYDINGLLENEADAVATASCDFMKDKKRKIILRFFTMYDKKVVKILELN